MWKKILAVIIAVILAVGIAITCFIVFAPKAMTVSAVDVPMRSDERGDYYELTSEWAFKFTAQTKTKYYDVSAEYEAVLGGSDVKMYFLEVKDGQESVYSLSMLDLALNFLSASVKGNVITLRTSKVLPLSDEEFKHGKLTLKYGAEYVDYKEYTVIDGDEKTTMLGSEIKAHNVANEKSNYFALTVNDVANELTETLKIWIVPGASNVALSVHRLKF